jgi:TetR/AcrR family transcriptional regulator, cholesterol catabolism regulator
MTTEATSRKDQLLAVSRKLFRDHGYRATSMRDIAAAMNIEAASLYNHIESKEEILRLTCFNLADEFIKAIEEVNDIYFDAEQKLQLAVKNHIRIITSNLDSAVVFLHEWRNLGSPHLEKFIEMRDQYEAGFMQILELGEAEHLFKESDKKFAMLTILSSLNWVVEWYKPDGKMSPDEIAERLTNFILSGLKRQ